MVIFCRLLLDAIVETANSSNFIKICCLLSCEDKYNKFVQCTVEYYSFCLVVGSSFCDNIQLDMLIKTLTENNILNKADHKCINKSENKKVCVLNTIHSKPINYNRLLKTSLNTKPFKQLQLKIFEKIAEITDDISKMEDSYGKLSDISTIVPDMKTATLSDDIADATATIITSTATITITTATITSTTTPPVMTNRTTSTATTAVLTDSTGGTNFAVISPTTANSATPQSEYEETLLSNTECSINKSNNPNFNTQDSTLPSSAITDVVYEYQTRLKYSYNNLPEISTQGWFDGSIRKQFINVTLVKSLEKDTHYREDYYSSTQQMIKGEVAYDTQKYVYYNDIFQVDCSTYQLLLIEGNAGVGKTTLSYKVCKRWAQGDVLQQYSCIVLVQLRDIKPSVALSLEDLLGPVGRPASNDLCTEVLKTHGSGLLIWLEGWDELDDSVVQNSAFDSLLYGTLLPKANVIITTRPSATRSLKKFNFTHKFKIIGFMQEQIKQYVTCYCANNLKLAEEFMAHLTTVPGLEYLSVVPMYLAILVRLFKDNKHGQWPQKLTGLCSSFITVCLQHHQEKFDGSKQPIVSFDKLQPEMQRIFDCMQKCAYDQNIFHSQRSLTEEEVSQIFFKCSSVPDKFDGLGLFTVNNIPSTLGISKTYEFQYKPIQEFLSALYLTGLKKPNIIIKEILENFKNKEFEMVWLFYAGLTGLSQVSIEEVLKHNIVMVQPQSSIILPTQSLKGLVTAWKQCHTYYMDMVGKFSMETLLLLILCCYESDNSKACKVIVEHLYADKVCRFEIPPNHATPYLLLAVSYFISHSGKTWSLRCNTVIQSSVQLLFKHINTRPEATSCLWVLCCVVTFSEIDAYCDAIKSQSLLQWIHLLPGSYLGDEGAKKLCECLYYESQVIKIEIDECGIGSHGLKHIGRMLKCNSKILCVNIRRNHFALDDVKDFLQHIKQRPYLQSLLLDDNYCKNSDICAIIEEIKVNRVKSNAAPLIVSHR